MTGESSVPSSSSGGTSSAAGRSNAAMTSTGGASMKEPGAGPAPPNTAAKHRSYSTMSSGLRINVARPAQYTSARVATPSAASASAKTTVEPAGTSRPASRSTRANRTGTASREAATESGTACHHTVHDLVEPVGAHPLLILAVLQDRPERRADCRFVDALAAEPRK